MTMSFLKLLQQVRLIALRLLSDTITRYPEILGVACASSGADALQQPQARGPFGKCWKLMDESIFS